MHISGWLWTAVSCIGLRLISCQLVLDFPFCRTNGGHGLQEESSGTRMVHLSCWGAKIPARKVNIGSRLWEQPRPQRTNWLQKPRWCQDGSTHPAQAPHFRGDFWGGFQLRSRNFESIKWGGRPQLPENQWWTSPTFNMYQKIWFSSILINVKIRMSFATS